MRLARDESIDMYSILAAMESLCVRASCERASKSLLVGPCAERSSSAESPLKVSYARAAAGP